MSVALWIAVGVTGYLMVAALGILLCRGIAMADDVEARRVKSAGAGPASGPRVPRPRPSVSVGSRPVVR